MVKGVLKRFVIGEDFEMSAEKILSKLGNAEDDG